MDAIINFFNSIANSVVFLIQYVTDMIEDMVEMAVMLGQAAVDLPAMLAFLPPPIVLMLTTFLTAAILYKVLGREG